MEELPLHLHHDTFLITWGVQSALPSLHGMPYFMLTSYFYGTSNSNTYSIYRTLQYCSGKTLQGGNCLNYCLIHLKNWYIWTMNMAPLAYKYKMYNININMSLSWISLQLSAYSSHIICHFSIKSVQLIVFFYLCQKIVPPLKKTNVMWHNIV